MKFTIPVEWMCCAQLEIEAESLEKALEIADNEKLPEDWEYVDGSYEIRVELIDEYNPFVEEIKKIDNTPRKELPLLIGKFKTKEAQQYLEAKLKRRLK